MKNKSVVLRLTKWFLISFILTILLSFLVAVVTQFIWFSDRYSDNFPYNITSQEKLDESIQSIINIAGWVEALDTEYVVTKVYGTKKNDEYDYEEAQLLTVTSANSDTNNKFRGFLVKRTDSEGYYLVMISRVNYVENIMIKLKYSPINIQSLQQKILIMTLILLYFMIFAGMCIYIYIEICKPLKQISEGIWKMKNGDEQVQIKLHGAREFTEIRDVFNMMVYTIQIEKQKRDEEEMKKQKMLLNLSHDIRTPIATINSCALALNEGIVKEEQKHEYYQVIQRKASRVSNLTEDMFTLLKMKDGEYQLLKEKGDLCEFIREQCVEYYCDAENESITIEVEIPDKSIYFEADYTLLAMAVGNVISNAIKYNKTGNHIYVKLNSEIVTKKLTISICDNGTPIENDLRTHLFDDFTRGDIARKTTGGTGMGLAITKAIIEKHNGNVEYKYDCGMNCFVIELSWDGETYFV